MAKTFYGYAEREAGSNVDWSQIGSDISEMLNEEISRRVTLKADLDKSNALNGPSSGDNKDICCMSWLGTKSGVPFMGDSGML